MRPLDGAKAVLVPSLPEDHSCIIQLALAATMSSASSLKGREKADEISGGVSLTFSSTLLELFDRHLPIVFL